MMYDSAASCLFNDRSILLLQCCENCSCDENEALGLTEEFFEYGGLRTVDSSSGLHLTQN
jgi:hypothetical protein